ncbi:MAG TPA: alpha/beta fold hydrolase [Elusimicrobiales bacterium]|nr:alpha/beta fold hydrolase [Elusimicrobiales bacterium]
MRTLILFLAAALLPAAAPALAGQATVHFNTSDGCAIEAFYQAPSSGAYVFINTHGLGSDKSEWGSLQAALKARGLGYLSLDMRGHGASLKCSGKEVSYKSFSKADWNAISRDIEAAAAWLKKKKIPASKMVFCGASIGANLSIKAASEGAIKPAAAILLSPGLEYAGVKSEPALVAAQPLRVLIAASEDDAYAWQSGNYLAAYAAKKGFPVVFKAGPGGHGVNMFQGQDLMTTLIDWAQAPGKK